MSLGCLFVTYFQSENSVCVVRDCDGAAILTLVMARHADNRRVQSAAAAAMRNIVSRNKELCAAFVERGVEELLDTAMEKHSDKIGQLKITCLSSCKSI